MIAMDLKAIWEFSVNGKLTRFPAHLMLTKFNDNTVWDVVTM